MAKTDSKATAPVTDPAAPPADAYDPQVQERLWRVSLELTGAPEPP